LDLTDFRNVTGSPGQCKKYRQAPQPPDPRRLQTSLNLQSPAETPFEKVGVAP
jgi:hypothetical protein